MANGDILATRIPASAGKMAGSLLEVDISSNTLPGTGGTYAFGLGASNNPSTAKIVLTVTSLGYDQAGNATTRTRTLYGTSWLRQVTPNQALADEVKVSTTLTVRVVLSDFVYASDTSLSVSIAAGFYTQGGQANNSYTGTPTNSSTLAYPKSVVRFAWPSFETVAGAFTMEAIAANRFARNGQQVACCVFTVTDGTTTVTKTVTDMTISPKGGPSPNSPPLSTRKPNVVLAYIADFDAASFTQAAVLTGQVTVYPWVGDSGSVVTSNNGITPPDERFCAMKFVCDKTGGYGAPAVYFDPTNGAAWASGSANVRATEALAYAAYDPAGGGVRTVSYNTLGGCLQALKAYNNTNNGRNSPANGRVLHSGIGTMNWDTGVVGTDLGLQDAWVIVKPGTGIGRAAAVVSATTQDAMFVRKIKIEGCTISGAAVGMIKSADSTVCILWVDNCTINTSGDATFYIWRLCHGTRCDVLAMTTLPMFKSYNSVDRSPWGLLRGMVGWTNAEVTGSCYAFIGNYNFSPVWQFGADKVHASDATSENGLLAFCSHYQLSLGAIPWFKLHTAAVVSDGIAIIQCLAEKYQIDAEVLLTLAGDAAAGALNNVLIHHCTLLGERCNVGYNDGTGTGGVAASYNHTNWSIVATILDEFNNKDDTFPTANAARVGSWPVGYAVGWRGNHFRTARSLPEWLGEFPAGIWGKTGGLHGFVRDNSANNLAGTAAGGGGLGVGLGDYHLSEISPAFLLNGGDATLPYDLEGNPRLMTGGSAGAYEKRAQIVIPAGRSSSPIAVLA